MSKLKISAVALAAMGVFSGAAQAQSYVASSGASALRGTTLAIFAGTCGASTPQAFNAAAADGGSNVRAVRCGASGGKVFSLDTDGGSWRAYAVQNLAQVNAQALALAATDPTVKRIRYLDLALCPTTGGTIAVPVACSAGAAKVVQAGNPAGAPSEVSIGFTDVNPAFFDGLNGINLGQDFNRPNGFQGWPKFTSTVTNSFPGLGAVFGVIASRPLYVALQADQGITGACVGDLATPACAPVITKDQYRAIASANFGQLNQSLANLFRGAVPANIAAAGVQLERRDWGSGTQAAANAYFHGVGCTPYFLNPATSADSDGAGYLVTENAASGDVTTRVSAAVAAVGVLSRESTPTAAGNWGFLKLATGAERGAIAGLDAGYPSNAAATRGLYDFWTVAWVHAKAGATGDVATLVSGLQAGTGFTPGAGTIKLADLVTGTNGTGTGTVTTGTYYNKAEMSGACAGALSN